MLWWLTGDPRLSDRARARILERPGAFVSAASTWEVTIKRALGKLRVELPEGVTFPSHCKDQGFVLIDVAHADAWAVNELPTARSDPFDRLIAATARRRGLTVATADPAFGGLDVSVLRI